MERDVKLMLIGVEMSTPVAVLISWAFYWLNDQSLRRYVDTLIALIASGGEAIVERNSKGRVTAIHVHKTVSDTGTLTATEQSSVIVHEGDPETTLNRQPPWN
jgi:hypothetical protein